MTELALRPRSASEIIDLAVRLLRRHSGPLATIALVGALPVLVVNLAFVSLLGGDPTRVFAFFSTFFSGYGLLAYVLLLLVRAFTFAALTVAADDALRTGTVDVASVLRRSVPRIGVVFVVLLVASIGFGVGFLILIVPGVYLVLRLATALPVAAVEGAGVGEALGRSWRRADGHLVHTLKVLLLLLLIYFVFAIMVSVIAGLGPVLGGGWAFSGAGLVVSQVLGTLLTAVVYPLLTNALLALSYDLRVRREGYDVEAMADALGATP